MGQHYITKAPEYIGILREDKTSLVVSIVAIAVTLLAVIVAFLQEWIRQRANKSILDMKINLTPPDCHQIMLTETVTMPGGHIIRNYPIGHAIYIRILVENLNDKPGENTEIMLSKFSTINSNGTKKPVKHFLPMNLVWSHFQPPTHMVRIPSSLFRHCDFGHFIKKSSGCILELDTIVKPNQVSGGEIPNVIKPGKYEFELRLSGDNVKPITRRWALEFPNKWSENEETMLNYIKFNELE